jgi:hypothetical protein
VGTPFRRFPARCRSNGTQQFALRSRDANMAFSDFDALGNARR